MNTDTPQSRGVQVQGPCDLAWAAVQVNLRGGRLPESEANGVSYLRVPINLASRLERSSAL